MLFDQIGARNRAQSREIGRASYGLLFAIAERILDADLSLLIEGNFSRGVSEKDLLGLTDGRKAVLIHCHAPKEVIVTRLSSNRGDRHPGHFDQDALPDVLAAIDAGAYEPLEMKCPTLVVDTSDGYQPSRDHIAAFAADQ